MARTCFLRWLPVWIILGALLQAPPADARSKTDVIVLDNGDRITCEIRQLQRGVLTVTTDYVKDAIAVEWLQVREVSSSQFFEVELEDGDRYYGVIVGASDAGRMVVMTGVTTEALEYQDVVRIVPLEERFRDRLRASLDVGIAAAKAHTEQTYNLAAAATYRTRKLKYASSVNSFISARDDAATTQRNDLTFSLDRAFEGTWSGALGARLENNNELNLDLRSTVYAGAGRFFLQSNQTLLSWLGGLAGNRERYAGEPDSRDNLEGILQLQYQLFVSGRRDTDITARLNVLPGISSWGRVRSNLEARIRHEIFSDLYWGFNLVADYDNQPPQGSDGFDWNLSSSIGYTF